MAFSKSKFSGAFLGKPICHRGLHDKNSGIWENSMEAIEAAIEAQLPIEFDVQNTKDGRAVVFHDAGLERMTGQKGRVRDKSLAEMEAIRLHDNNHIASLKTVLERVGGKVPLLVELKDQDGKLGPELGTFLPDIVDIVEKYDGPLALMSFNPYLVNALNASLSNWPIGLTTDPFFVHEWPKVPAQRRKKLRAIAEIPGLKYDFVSHNWKDLARVEGLDCPKLCWTIKSADAEAKAREIADNITFEGFRPEGL